MQEEDQVLHVRQALLVRLGQLRFGLACRHAMADEDKQRAGHVVIAEEGALVAGVGAGLLVEGQKVGQQVAVGEVGVQVLLQIEDAVVLAVAVAVEARV